MTTKDGGPAFPCAIPVENGMEHYAGISLRDWFAAQALVGMLAKLPSLASEETPEGLFANQAYRMADAMLDAREAQP